MTTFFLLNSGGLHSGGSGSLIVTVHPSGITDREKYVRIDCAFHSIYRYRRRHLVELICTADADIAALCAVSREPHSR